MTDAAAPIAGRSGAVRPGVMVLGHSAEIHDALRSVFDLVHIVADTATADESWDEVHLLRGPLQPPSPAAMNDGTFEQVLRNYQRFADINSRRFVGITAQETETFNGFVATFYWAHRRLTEKAVDAVLFHNFPHEGFDYVVYLVARALGIRTIATHQVLVGARFWICENLETFGDFARSPRLFDLEPSGYELPQTWFYMAGAAKDWSYHLRHVAAEVLRRPWRLPPAAIRWHNNQAFRRDRQRTMGAVVENEPFIYFPLHMQPELTTTAMGGQGGRYADQISAIEQLSLMAPDGVSIYLKENPKQTAQQRGPLFYRRLEALPNVRFVPTTLPSVQLIQKSIGVGTVTGTAGWEALFHGKPVIAFGNAWYLPFAGVTQYRAGVTHEQWTTHLPQAPAEIVRALDDLLTRTGKGYVDPLHGAAHGDFDGRANAEQVAMSLGRYWAQTAGERA